MSELVYNKGDIILVNNRKYIVCYNAYDFDTFLKCLEIKSERYSSNLLDSFINIPFGKYKVLTNLKVKAEVLNKHMENAQEKTVRTRILVL